jgi:hypothetical protein
VPPLEAWEKVLLDSEDFLESVHGGVGCTTCHGGANEPDKEIAHTDMIRDPSAAPETTCGQCHPDLIEPHTQSLHATLEGYTTVMAARSNADDPETWGHIEEMMGNHCETCHTTCGQCHVSQPTSVGGGLLDGHTFLATPPMSRTCTACHGSRVGNEYLGKNEGFMADVHFREGRMACVDCHDSAEMHGEPADCASCHTGPESDAPHAPATHRYAGIQSPRCESCHIEAASGLDNIDQHGLHNGQLSCQVCHSVSYKSCDGCHTQLNEEGVPFFETDGSYMTFLIGQNTLQSYERPYAYVPVRHVPIAEDSFDYYGEDLLSNFVSEPTWRYTTPHNIQRNTPQTETCNACHGNADLFLTADKVSVDERYANQEVIIDKIPNPIP